MTPDPVITYAEAELSGDAIEALAWLLVELSSDASTDHGTLPESLPQGE
jgi:hypothetical protein